LPRGVKVRARAGFNFGGILLIRSSGTVFFVIDKYILAGLIAHEGDTGGGHELDATKAEAMVQPAGASFLRI
jgi:hypothetical protein